MIYFQYEIVHLASQKTEYLWDPAGYVYQLPHGHRLRMHTTPVWCYVCGKFTNGEHIESLEELDRQLRQFRDGNDPALALPSIAADREATARELIVEWERRREWRRARIAPAKCTDCGSTRILIPPWDEPFPHPLGSGKIQINCDIGGGVSIRGEVLFTPEGDLVKDHTDDS